jgi:obg-like ATPase 1
MAALEPNTFDDWSARPMLPTRSQVLRRHRSDIRVAILGLPNSGKTSLFNLLTGLAAPVDDAAFSTREAQTGISIVEDPRFAWLCGHFEPAEAVPCRVRVVDTPALVTGAADNNGLGSVGVN